MTDPFDLTGRVAIVTGGSRGLGRAMAGAFAERGAHVVVAARDPENCARAVQEIESAGGSALAVPTDLASNEGLAALVETTVGRFGGLDILVNNAADSTLTSAADCDIATWDRVMTINSRSPFFLARAALPHLQLSDHASVINLLSIGAWNGGPGLLLYRASKGALLGTTMVLAKEWGPLGIRVNAIAPGTFETDMIDWMDAETRQRAIEWTPLGRIAAPREIVPAALFLASDASSFATGSVVRVDGGMLSF